MARIEKWDEVHGNQAPDERMMAFLDGATDQYAILQLRRSEDTVYERFSSMRELERILSVIDYAVNHTVIVFHCHFCGFQIILRFQKSRQLLEADGIHIVTAYNTILDFAASPQRGYGI